MMHGKGVVALVWVRPRGTMVASGSAAVWHGAEAVGASMGDASTTMKGRGPDARGGQH
jgi:hypothetical protein